MALSNTRRMEKQLESAFSELQEVTRDQVYEVDFKRWFKVMLEDCMLTEFEERIVCVPSHERDEQRRNQRNGFYYRSLQTVLGLIADLKVPRPREGGFTPSIFEYKANQVTFFLDRLFLCVQSKSSRCNFFLDRLFLCVQGKSSSGNFFFGPTFSLCTRQIK